MDQHTYTTIRLANWQDFKLYIQQFSSNWAYRGQASADWVLNNAIERTEFIHFHKSIESDFVAEFQRGARNYLSKDETPGHLIEWLALMQHHGAPTRLLDLTKSPFIAAYFAFEICIPEVDQFVAIWSINFEYLKNRALKILAEEFEEAVEQNKNLINETLFEKIFYENNRNLVFPVEPFSMNKRYSLQQSIFISTGISHIPLMEQLKFLGVGIKQSVIKIEIPSDQKKFVLRDLQQMNLHRASLFPDLDGYASSMKLRYDSMQSPDEKKQEEIEKQNKKDYPFIP